MLFSPDVDIPFSTVKFKEAFLDENEKFHTSLEGSPFLLIFKMKSTIQMWGRYKADTEVLLKSVT
jgi:hypothetical protein